MKILKNANYGNGDQELIIKLTDNEGLNDEGLRVRIVKKNNEIKVEVYKLTGLFADYEILSSYNVV